MKAHLIDGTYELFRAYYGGPGATGPAGDDVGATRTFLRSMLALLRDGATHVGIAFDTVIESFRNDMFAGYKTGDGVEPALMAQFPLAEQAARALGVAAWGMVEFEADDALASAAHALADDPRVEQIVLVSPDKDLAQCVRGQHVVCLDRMRGKVLDTAGVRAKFGVDPASIPDYLGLVGDTADGIPGVPRWGAKSTAAVLSRYGHIEDIPDDEAAWDVTVRGAAGLARSLREHRPEALLYRDLATLRVDAPVAATVEDLQWRGADRALMAELCERIGDRTTPDRVPLWRD